MNDTALLLRLPRVTENEVLIRRLVARAKSPLDPTVLAAVTRDLFGEPVRATVLPMLFRAAPKTAIAGPVAVLVPPSGDDDAAVVLEFDEPLARTIIDRVLGGNGAHVPPAKVAPLSDTELGVLAFGVAHALAEIATWRLGSVLAASPNVAGASLDADAVLIPIRVEWGDHVGQARLHISEPAARTLEQRASNTSQANPVMEVVCDLGAATLYTRQLETIVPGDAITLDAFWGGVSDSPRSCVARLLTSGSIAFSCAQSAVGLVVECRSDSGACSVGRGARMTDEITKKVEPAEIHNDVPVEIAVEVARTQLPLHEFASLQEGEVLLTGQPLNGAVTLRTAGRAIATGELVQINGEIAVRVRTLVTR